MIAIAVRVENGFKIEAAIQNRRDQEVRPQLQVRNRIGGRNLSASGNSGSLRKTANDAFQSHIWLIENLRMKIDCREVFPKWDAATRGFEARVCCRSGDLWCRLAERRWSLDTAEEQRRSGEVTKQQDRSSKNHTLSLRPCPQLCCVKKHTARSTAPILLRGRSRTSLR